MLAAVLPSILRLCGASGSDLNIDIPLSPDPHSWICLHRPQGKMRAKASRLIWIECCSTVRRSTTFQCHTFRRDPTFPLGHKAQTPQPPDAQLSAPALHLPTPTATG